MENLTTHNAAVSTKLYEKLAHQVVSMIENGTLEPGTRVPSVRQVSIQQQVSISTALQAYRHLEAEGYLEARPQSGYYVRYRPEHLPFLAREYPLPEPEVSQPAPGVTELHNRIMVSRVMAATRISGLFQLGAAICCPSFLPTEQLHKAARTVMQRDPEGCNSYDFSPGCPQLRQSIARRSLEYGLTLNPDEIVLTCGASEGLTLCLRAITKEGDAVAVASPTYYGILQIIESLGLRAVEVATHPREGVVIEALEEALERETISACLFMPSIGNPLGCSMTAENKARLVKLLEEREVPLIEDDVWGDTWFEGPRPRPVKSFDITGNVLLVSSFSKMLAQGYRVGWVSGGRYHSQIEYLKLASSEGNPILLSRAVAEFMEKGGYNYHLRRVRRTFQEQCAMALQELASLFPEGTRVARPQGGHFLWVELPGGIQALDLFEEALRRGVSIAPGPMFSARQKFNSFVRLNCGYHSQENTRAALDIVGRIAHEMLRR